MQIISPDLITRLQKHMKILCLVNTPDFYQSPDFLYQKYTRKYHQMSFIKIKANTVSQQEQGQEGQLFLPSPRFFKITNIQMTVLAPPGFSILQRHYNTEIPCNVSHIEETTENMTTSFVENTTQKMKRSFI